MRIISSEHDYYDVVQAQGQDQTLLYLRKAEEIDLEDYPFPYIGSSRNWGYKSCPAINEAIIGFCGRIYPVLCLSEHKWGSLRCPTPAEATCFTMAEVDAFMEANYRDKELEEYRAKPKKGKYVRTRYWDSGRRRVVFEKFFADCEAKQDAFQQMFMERRSPIFVARHSHEWRRSGTITWNALLKNHQFFRLFDPYRAFQEIAMFMSNLAVPLKPIPAISDKVLAGAKGFDKWSFRKPPQGK